MIRNLLINRFGFILRTTNKLISNYFLTSRKDGKDGFDSCSDNLKELYDYLCELFPEDNKNIIKILQDLDNI